MSDDSIFMSESVTEGHPDKLCDRISDAILDRFLQQDPFSRIIVECAVATGLLFIAARFASKAVVDLPSVARQLIARTGYRDEGFDPKTCGIMTSLNEIGDAAPVPDEADLSDAEIERIPAQSPVTLFGFATVQTPVLMPLPIWLAHKLARRLSAVRRSGEISYLAPDGKTQVAVEFRKRRPTRIHSITVIAALRGDDPHDDTRVRNDVIANVIEPVFAEEEIRPDLKTQMFVNPGGPFLVGGPGMHSGLTGRKNGVDTYGEYARQSGAALSGKDPGRIDRIGAYIARYAAKAVVEAELATDCEVQLSYAIGQARPVSLQVDSFGSGRIPDREIAARLLRVFDFRPAAIVRRFDLRRLPGRFHQGFYERIAAYGQVGRTDIDLPWEAVDLADALR